MASAILQPRVRALAGGCVSLQRVEDDWYSGTANAVYQNSDSIEESGADDLLAIASDHVY
jgi:ADP-glucose pyrophosphorylase